AAQPTEVMSNECSSLVTHHSLLRLSGPLELEKPLLLGTFGLLLGDLLPLKRVLRVQVRLPRVTLVRPAHLIPIAAQDAVARIRTGPTPRPPGPAGRRTGHVPHGVPERILNAVAVTLQQR